MTHPMVACIGVLGLLLAQLSAASAQTLCSRPVQPLCTTDMQSVDTGPERLRCLEDTARYLNGLEEYRDCLGGSLANAEALVEATKRFRSCLRGDGENCTIEETD